MHGKDNELNLDQLQDAQGGASFELSAQKAANRSELGESEPKALGDDVLQAISGGAAYGLSAQKAANRSESEEIDPKWVIQDPWGDPAGEGEVRLEN